MSDSRSQLCVAKRNLRENFEHTAGSICPVPDKEYLSVVEGVFSSFIDIALGQDDERFDVLMGDYRFLVFLIQHLHMRALNISCEQSGLDLILDNSQEQLLTPDWDLVGGEYQQSLSTRSIKRQWASVLWSNLKSPQGLVCGITGTTTRWPHALVIGRVDRLCKEYAQQESQSWLQFEPGLLIRECEGSAVSRAKWEEAFVRPFLERIPEETRESFATTDIPVIASNWARRLAEAEAIYRFFRRRKKRFQHLLVNGGTNPLRKLMVMGYQRAGAKVAVFHHGNDFGGRIQPFGHMGEVSHCRKFVCPTPWIAENYRYAYSGLQLEKRSDTQYFSVGTRYFQEIHEASNNASKAPRGGRSPIMLIGRPINDRRLLDASGAFLLQKLFLERALIQITQEAHEVVLYKAHPESAEFAELAFSKICEVVSTPLEEIYYAAKCLIFTTATSTAFGFAMATTVPIVLIEHEANAWQEHVWDRVGNRCATVKYSVDSQGYPLVTSESICQAIQEAEDKSGDTSFLNTLTQETSPASDAIKR